MPEILRIGGTQYNWNSTLTRIDGQLWRGLTSVDWGEKLDVETVYSQTQDGVPIGDTAGQYAVESVTIKMLREYWSQLRFYLSFTAPGMPAGTRGPPGSYGRTKFMLQVTAAEDLEIGAVPVHLDAGPCRVIGVKETTEKGAAALETEITLWCLQVTNNGQTLYTPSQPGF